MADSHPIQNAPPAALPSSPPGRGELHRLSLVKGEQRWIFQWEAGNEATVISHVADLARDPHKPFDWLDAAAVCRAIARPAPADSAAP